MKVGGGCTSTYEVRNWPSSTGFEITGGVIVYSEPTSHLETASVSPWGVAVDVHPKHFQDLTSKTLLYMKNLLCSPYVVALGEVGFDRTVPIKLWRRQEEVFRQVLTLIRMDKFW